MLRVVLALNIFLFNLYACQGGYNSCVKKIQDSKSIQNKKLYIPIANNKRLVFSHTKPKGKILKHDPFLSLYIVKDTQKFKYPFTINMRYPSGLGIVNQHKAKETRISKRQIGLNEFGVIKTKLSVPALLTNSCCSLEGIVTGRGIIEKAYIKRFIEKKDIRYADIGIRVKDTKRGIAVTSFDPFMKNNPFKKGDIIVAMDGRPVKYSATLMQRILFSRIGSRHNVKVKRNGKLINIKVRSQKRLSGGYKVETYLEQYGLTFDKNLYITRIDKTKKFYGLMIGDKLLKVNAHNVNKQEDVMKYISDFKFHPRLLFERNANFQFFVNMD